MNQEKLERVAKCLQKSGFKVEASHLLGLTDGLTFSEGGKEFFLALMED